MGLQVKTSGNFFETMAISWKSWAGTLLNPNRHETLVSVPRQCQLVDIIICKSCAITWVCLVRNTSRHGVLFFSVLFIIYRVCVVTIWLLRCQGPGLDNRGGTSRNSFLISVQKPVFIHIELFFRSVDFIMCTGVNVFAGLD